jgi:hypothetical protein
MPVENEPEDTLPAPISAKYASAVAESPPLSYNEYYK